MRSLTTRYSKQYSGRRLPALVAIVASVLLGLGLAACQSVRSDSYTSEIANELMAADIGIADVDVSTSLNGFTRNIAVTATFDPLQTMTTTQLKAALSAVDQILKGNSKSNLMMLFNGADGGPVDGFGAAVDGLNDVDELAGRARSGDEYPALYFNPVSDLSDLVTQFEGGK